MSDSERLKKIISLSNKSAKAFSEDIGLKSPQVLYDVLRGRNGISKELANSIKAKCVNYNLAWVLTGEGEMFVNSENDESENTLVPLLPISAQGGSFNDFLVSIKANEVSFEKIVSPIRGTDFAITVSGESMSPEYPAGSKVLIKKVNEQSFIEWGRCYALDTCNGVVIKLLDAPEEEDPNFGFNYVTCVSINPNPIYKPFRVGTKDIYAIYRVLMLLAEK